MERSCMASDLSFVEFVIDQIENELPQPKPKKKRKKKSERNP